MADLSIVVEIDNGQFNSKLDEISKKLNDLASSMSTSFQAVQDQLKNVQDNMGNVSKELGTLGTVLTGFFTLGAIEKFGAWANTIDQTAKSIGFTTGEMLALQSAMAQVGGNTQAAGRAVEMFYMKLDQARQGGLQQQVAFERLGITLNDLKKYDDQDLFRITLDRLAQLPRNAASSRIEVELFSKSMRGIPVQEFNDAFKKAEENTAAYGSAVSDAAAAFRKLQEILTDIKIAVAVVFDPLTKAFASIKVDVPEIIAIMRDVAAAIIGIKVAAYATTAALAAMAVAEAEVTGGLSILLSAFVKTVAGAATFGASELVLNKYLGYTTEKIKEASAEQKKHNDELNKATGEGQAVYTAYAKLIEAIKQQTLAFEANIQRQIADIGIKDQSIGKSLEQIAALREETKIRDEYGKKLDELRIKLKEAEAARPEDAISRTTGALKTAIAELTAQRDKDIASAGAAAAIYQHNLELDKSTLQLKEQQLKLNEDLLNIQQGIDELTMTNGEKAIAQIQKQTQAKLDAAKKEAQIRLGSQATDLDINNEEIYKAQVKAILDAQDQLIAKTKQSNDAARDWATGWNAAFNKYKSDATDAASTSKKLFDDATMGMEDAIVNFAKTGKLSFDTLLQNIAEDILRSQIKQLFAQLMSPIGTGGSYTSGGTSQGGLLSGLGKLLGFADGGTIPTNAPVLVGERGPEIISGAAGMTVTPNNQLGGSNMTNVTYNINATDARSFQQMIAQDPSFIYAVTVRGQNMIPGGGFK